MTTKRIYTRLIFFHTAGIFLHTSFTTQCFFIHDFSEYAGHIFRAVHNRVDKRTPQRFFDDGAQR